jgi:membrane protein YdbS with pleckstrin-like domain
MICHRCGADLPTNAAFCPQCGVAQSDDENRPPADHSATEQFRDAARSRQQVHEEPEEKIWEGHFSPWAMIGWWSLAGIATIVILIGGVMAASSGMAWGALAVSILLLWLALYLVLVYRQWTVRYELTNQRLIHERGLLWRSVDRIELIDMDDVTYRQSPIERPVGVGTIIIRSSDQSDPQFILPGIEQVRDVASRIDELRRRERRRRGLHIESV